jgi:outer membrane protein insertion porin family
VTLALNGEVGYVAGLGGKQVPFFKNFYAGGPGSVRGYKAFSLGEQDSAGNVLGGTRKVTGSAEVLFPVPGAQQDKSLRLAVFLDGGQVFSSGPTVAGNVSGGGPRFSSGVALAWNSPFGPLKISFALPLNAVSGFDRREPLQLNFGTAF